MDWQPTFGNVEALLVQICAFLAMNARVASLARSGGGGGHARAGAAGAGAEAGAADAGAAEPPEEDDEAMRKKAARAYENLKAFHAKKGWGSEQPVPPQLT